MNYQQALDYLYSQLPMFHRIGAPAYKADLNNTLNLAEVTGFPYKSFNSIHIAGTNGKGSVSHMLASAFQESGYNTGLFTSPHLLDFRERIKINGKMITTDYVADFVDNYQQDFTRIKPSFFEMTFILAMCYFRDSNVDIAIIETGLGGRLDSTNVITPELSIITNIGFDHMQFLGNSLKEIAYEKAGIIKDKVPVVIGESNPETDEVFLKKALDSNSKIIFADKTVKANRLHCNLKESKAIYSANIAKLPVTAGHNQSISEIKITCPLMGDYQIKNLQTVTACLPFLDSYITIPNLIEGINRTILNTGLKGRWQILQKQPLTICDIGHNSHGLEWVVRQIKELTYNRLHFVLGVVNDKDIVTMLSMLPADATYYFCKADIPRGLDSSILKQQANEAHLYGESYSSVKEAYLAAKNHALEEDLIFIGGSAFVVAEVLPMFE